MAVSEAMTRQERLLAFLNEYGEGPCVWGFSDCSAAPAAWMASERGAKIALPKYGSRDEAEAIIADHGGLTDVWSEIARLSGIHERYGDPELGDVAIIETRILGQIGGICGHGRVLMIRREEGGWHPLGPVRNFVKVFAIQ